MSDERLKSRQCKINIISAWQLKSGVKITTPNTEYTVITIVCQLIE